MATITIQETYARVKRQLSEDTGRPPGTIRADHDLRNDYHYATAGLRALERSLNIRFHDVAMTPITAGQFTNNPNIKTVRHWTLGC